MEEARKYLVLGFSIFFGLVTLVKPHSHDEKKPLDTIVKLGDDFFKEIQKVNHRFLTQGIDHEIDASTTDGQFNIFASEDEQAVGIDHKSQFILATEKKFLSVMKVSMDVLRSSENLRRIWDKAIQTHCPYKKLKLHDCEEWTSYRTYDGSCNSPIQPEWGQSFTPQRRFMPAVYNDGVEAPRTKSVLGSDLISAREVSNKVFKGSDSVPDHPKHTVMVMAWGQFVDHDIIKTPMSRGENGSALGCCGSSSERPECFPITIPQDDPFFTEQTCMNFARSAPATSFDCSPGHREQLNTATAFIDASSVYGSTTKDALRLREESNGRMKVSTNEMLPELTIPKKVPCKKHGTHFCFDAGDGRVNVVPNLGALHMVFVREHNRLVKNLAKLNPHWDDERLYQEARKIVGAYMQHFTYNEYLPVILGESIMKKYDLLPSTGGVNNKYYVFENPSVTNVFGVAAFRFGHSEITNIQAFSDSKGEIKKMFDIEETFLDPGTLQDETCKSACPMITNWMVTDRGAVADRVIASGVRDKLFLDTTKNTSLDLAAINVQRGRDHGIPSYTAWRKWLGLSDIKSFGPSNVFGLKDHTEENAALLKDAYDSVDDIDLFAGAMTETHLEDASVGPVFAHILAKQFKALKFGDRFWYENGGSRTGFNDEQIKSIKKVKLAKILCENMGTEKIQPNVMEIPSDPRNLQVKCDDLDDLNFDLWKDMM